MKETVYSKKARTRARRNIIQAYYQWILNKMPVSEIIDEFENERNELKNADIVYFEDVLNGMVNKSDYIDEILRPVIQRPGNELDPVESAVLHLAIYELTNLPEIPQNVIINEAVELAKLFGATQSHKFINGVLDKLAKSIRQPDVNIAN